MAAWKSIECIIGAAITCIPGAGSSLRLVIENLMRSPTRARTTGPGTWLPNVHALNFTPGAISMIVCVVSSLTSFTGLSTSGFTIASRLNASPLANGPVCRSVLNLAGPGLKSILDWSYGSAAGADDALAVVEAGVAGAAATGVAAGAVVAVGVGWRSQPVRANAATLSSGTTQWRANSESS